MRHVHLSRQVKKTCTRKLLVEVGSVLQSYSGWHRYIRAKFASSAPLDTAHASKSGCHCWKALILQTSERGKKKRTSNKLSVRFGVLLLHYLLDTLYRIQNSRPCHFPFPQKPTVERWVSSPSHCPSCSNCFSMVSSG